MNTSSYPEGPSFFQTLISLAILWLLFGAVFLLCSCSHKSETSFRLEVEGCEREIPLSLSKELSLMTVLAPNFSDTHDLKGILKDFSQTLDQVSQQTGYVVFGVYSSTGLLYYVMRVPSQHGWPAGWALLTQCHTCDPSDLYAFELQIDWFRVATPDMSPLVHEWYDVPSLHVSFWEQDPCGWRHRSRFLYN